MEKYYIAYGSNLNIKQMQWRCPGATVVGTGFIKDYQLLFKGSKTGSYLTIEMKKGKSVPIAVWKVNDEHIKALDRYEGYPTFYYKQEMEIDIKGIKTKKLYHKKAFVYIMNEDRELGIPYKGYIEICLEGYRSFGFSPRYLEEAIKISMEAIYGNNNERNKSMS